MDLNVKRKVVDSKVKMHCAGEKIKKSDYQVASSFLDRKMRFPSIYLSSVQAPELKGFDVNKTVKLMVEGIIRSHSLNEGNGKESKESFDIEIRKIGLSE